MRSKYVFRKALIILFWLAVWQTASVLINNRILLVGPVETLETFVRLLPEMDFLKAVAGTTFKVLEGFLLGALGGVVCAGTGCRFRAVREMLAPLVSVIRSIPIVSFVILLLIWQGSGRLSFFISLMVVFPIMYVNTLNGLLGMNTELVQMTRLLNVGWYEKLRYIYLPEIYSEMKSGLELSVSMGFKSGIAAEVVGQPAATIGNSLYQSKIYLETDRVLAYTLAAICAAWFLEKIIVFLWGVFFKPKGFGD